MVSLCQPQLRSNVESTFFMLKAKFSDLIRSKTETAQINELLLKVLCHNIVVVNNEVRMPNQLLFFILVYSARYKPNRITDPTAIITANTAYAVKKVPIVNKIRFRFV